MYKPLSEQCLRVMTAANSERIPSLDVIRKLPTIQMSLSPMYCTTEKSRENAEAVLRDCTIAPSEEVNRVLCECTVAEPKGVPSFGYQLPDVITGRNPDWALWRVDFYVGRLKLYYVYAASCDERYYRAGGTEFGSIGHFRSCAYAYLISPASLGLNFDIPELNWHIDYAMSCSSKKGAHSVRFTETLHGAPTGNFDWHVPSLDEFQPEPTYIP